MPSKAFKPGGQVIEPSLCSLESLGYSTVDGVLTVQSGNGDNSAVSPIALNLIGGHKYEISFEAIGSNMSLRPIFKHQWNWSQYIGHNPSDTWVPCQGTFIVPDSGTIPTQLAFFVNSHALDHMRNLRVWDIATQ